MTASAASVCEISAERFLDLAGGRGSWRQYPAYAHEAARRVGARVRFVSVEASGAEIALAAIRFRSLPLGLGATSLISQGPVLLRDTSHAAGDLAMATQALSEFAARQGWELRIDPDPLWWLEDAAGASSALPAGPDDETGYRTIVLDIARPLDEVRKGLDGKWRRSLQQAEKLPFDVTVSDRPEDIMQAQSLLADLMQRKTFAIPQDAAFFARVAERARGAEKIIAHTVRHEGRITSIHIGAFTGPVAVYLLGATTREGRNVGASYLAQWRVVETAIAMGHSYYDLGGIDPVENPDVYRFKKRMGGAELSLPPVVTISRKGPRAAIAGAARQMMTRGRS